MAKKIVRRDKHIFSENLGAFVERLRWLAKPPPFSWQDLQRWSFHTPEDADEVIRLCKLYNYNWLPRKMGHLYYHTLHYGSSRLRVYVHVHHAPSTFVWGSAGLSSVPVEAGVDITSYYHYISKIQEKIDDMRSTANALLYACETKGQLAAYAPWLLPIIKAPEAEYMADRPTKPIKLKLQKALEETRDELLPHKAVFVSLLMTEPPKEDETKVHIWLP